MPDYKYSLMRTGQPTNSFSTNEPKEYKEPNAAESAATIVGSGVAVAAMVENAGDLASAAEQVATAAVAAMTSQVTSIISEYAAKFATLPLSIPGGIASKTAERIGKSKGDLDRDGNEFDPVKMSLSDMMKKFTSPTENQNDAIADAADEAKKSKKIKNIQEKLKKASDSANKILAKSAEVISEIMTHAIEGPAWLQQQIDKEVSRAVQNVTKELDTAYKSAAEDIDRFCENEGYKIGTKVVKQYNNALEVVAKDVVDKKNKIEQKAKTKAKAAIQKAKLKIFALIGL